MTFLPISNKSVFFIFWQKSTLLFFNFIVFTCSYCYLIFETAHIKCKSSYTLKLFKYLDIVIMTLYFVLWVSSTTCLCPPPPPKIHMLKT